MVQRIRLYGADCNQSALVLDAIQQTKVNMTVFLGNYVIATDNNAAYDRQRDLIQQAIQTFGTDHIAGVTVGNEFMLNYLNANGATDPNSDVGNQGAALLMADINDTRTMINGMGLSKHIPVGTSDAGSYFNTLVLEDVEYGVRSLPWQCFFSLSYITSSIDGQRPSLVRQRINRHCRCLDCLVFPGNRCYTRCSAVQRA